MQEANPMQETAMTAGRRMTPAQQGKKTAAYLRLSREDGDKAESDSIQNQRDLIRDYVKDRPGITLTEEYVDDGYSGTNFDRPAFQRLIEDAKQGKVDCIIVKDLSRLGRNYIETGRYVERIFPFLGIRFIAVNDNYDSAGEKTDSDAIILPFKNLINDAYCRDISIKIRSQLEVKRKAGKFTGSFASYGYLKDPKDKNHLIVDEYAAEVVKLVFNLKIGGMGEQNIADKLTEMGALPPLEYKRMCGLNYNSGFRSGSTPKWTMTSVKRILQNEVYTGTVVQGKYRKISYKVKQSRMVPEENWVRVPDMHEAVIPSEIFWRVQQVMQLDTRTAPGKEKVSLLAGLVRCGDCGQSMIRRASRAGGNKRFYLHCSTYKNGLGCAPHMVNETRLLTSVAQAIEQQAKVILDAGKQKEKMTVMQEGRSHTDKIDVQLNALEAEIARYKDLKLKLYQDLKDGILDREEFREINERFTAKLESAYKAQSGLEKKKERLTKEGTEFLPWLDTFKSYGNGVPMERAVFVNLIECVEVYGKNSIQVRFRFQDELDAWLEGCGDNAGDGDNHGGEAEGCGS